MEGPETGKEELVRAGVRVAAEGLEPSSKGARITFGRGTTKVVDGPFAEAKEVLRGTIELLSRRANRQRQHPQ
jgi:hypothetical protein